jgi:Na+:H+ antiporter, NhaA family
LEHAIHPWVAFMILPVFAFANAGVQFVGMSFSHIVNPVSLGIAAGLFVGKQVGIFGACLLAVKLRLARLPTGTTWLQMYGTALLCGIGFTMSLFIGTLAFEGVDPVYLTSVKVGVLMGSLVSAVAGAYVLTIAREKPVPMAAEPIRL